MFSDSDTDTVTTKEETKIAVYATFVSTCLGAKHVPVIDNPIDLSSTLGFVTSYDDLFQKLKLYVESPTDETEETEKTDFHHDKKHTYTFEPKKLSKGCIWGLKNKRNDGDEKSRMTKSKLEPITSAEQFTDYISDCGDICISKRNTRRSCNWKNNIIILV